MITRNTRWQLIPPARMLPAMRYEIRIVGALSDSLLGAFPDFRAELCGGETALVGTLPDPAALHGVLAQIEALGLELVEVRRRLESVERNDDDPPRCARDSLAMNERSEIRRGQMEPLDSPVDHVRGAPAGRLIVEYGDYECPYSRQAFREIALVERRLPGEVRFAFRHFPLTEIHPHALAASAAAEAAALQDRFWEMHELLFHRQKALDDDDLRRYAGELGLDVEAFERDRAGSGVLNRVRRDVESGIASGEVRGTPTLFIDGVAHHGSYDAASLLEALTR
jgi:2-hydroxychromene-2-carboxylate isomerase